MPDRPTEAPQRVFFAIWPQVREAAALHRLACSLALGGARIMRAETLHLTLAFIGATSPEGVGRLREIGRLQGGRPMRLDFDEVSCWPRKRIAWAGCSRVPDSLQELVTGLSARLADAGFRLERRPFKAHVTLLRDAREIVAPPSLALSWQVSEFALVRSRLLPAGARYEIIERFPLVRA